MSRPNETDAIAAALAAPFSDGEVGFKPQTVAGNRALAVPYIDARDVMDRLDAVVGMAGWKDAYTVLDDGAVICTLSVRIGEEWISKTDVGGQSEQPDEGDRRKAAFSDALKRAAVKFGIGRYLYAAPLQWHDWDPQKRRFVNEPKAPRPPQPKPAPTPQTPRPAPAQPAAPRPAAQTQAQPQTEEAKEWEAKVRAFDAKLAAEGMCKPGELIRHLLNEAAGLGWPGELSRWDEVQRRAAKAETERFRQEQQPASDSLLEQLDAALAEAGETRETFRKAFKIAERDTVRVWHCHEGIRRLTARKQNKAAATA